MQGVPISVHPETTFRFESRLTEQALVRHSREGGNPETGLSGWPLFRNGML
jgi:hypothetical protein